MNHTKATNSKSLRIVKVFKQYFLFFHKTPGFDVKLYCPSRSINRLFLKDYIGQLKSFINWKAHWQHMYVSWCMGTGYGVTQHQMETQPEILWAQSPSHEGRCCKKIKLCTEDAVMLNQQLVGFFFLSFFIAWNARKYLTLAKNVNEMPRCETVILKIKSMWENSISDSHSLNCDSLQSALKAKSFVVKF